ncbi:unnamed protein product [Arctogadus glacialis]
MRWLLLCTAMCTVVPRDCWDSNEDSPPPLPARTPESFILASDPSEVKTSASAEWSCLHRDTAGSSKKPSPADPSLPGATAAVGKASLGGTR